MMTTRTGIASLIAGFALAAAGTAFAANGPIPVAEHLRASDTTTSTTSTSDVTTTTVPVTSTTSGPTTTTSTPSGTTTSVGCASDDGQGDDSSGAACEDQGDDQGATSTTSLGITGESDDAVGGTLGVTGSASLSVDLGAGSVSADN